VDYVWDGHVLAMEVDSSAGTKAFVHYPGTFIPLLQQEGGEVFTYVVDHVGTAKELLTPDGLVAWAAAHSAWGRVVAESSDPESRARTRRPITSPFRLLGQIADDELDLCFTRFRLFDPEVGRWISPDPVGLDGSSNMYAFDGAPSVVVDPWGLATSSVGGGSPHVVTVSRSRHPESAQHIEDAQAAGKPTDLTIDRGGAAARRAQSMQGNPPVAGKDRDEYPPAMFSQGGNGTPGGSSVRPIDPSDNRGAGSSIGHQCRGLPDGTTVQVQVVP
jgi:RHS repeat-associated protein